MLQYSCNFCITLLFTLVMYIPLQAQDDSSTQKCTQASTANARVVANTKENVPLSYLIPCVEQLLKEANSELMASQPAGVKMLPLTTAEFDFQAVTTTDVTGNIKILSIFTSGANRKGKATQETDITYSVPTAQNKFLAHNLLGDYIHKLFGRWGTAHGEAATLDKTLPEAIVAAMEGVQQYPSVTGAGAEVLTHRKIEVTISFEVDASFNADLDFSSLVIVGPEVKYNRERDNVQTLKLTFEDKSK